MMQKLLNAAPLIILVFVAMRTTSAFGLEPIYATEGKAIGGYDPVAYFTKEQAIKGDEDNTHEWEGVVWYFSSNDNLEAFKGSEEQYAPQYGGYCAWAVSQNGIADSDPENWTVYEGKLYLNFSERIHEEWKKDIPGNIVKADENWPEVLSTN